MDSIFSDVINLNKENFASLIEARYYLELNSARLAAERRDENDVRQMREAMADFEEKTRLQQPVVQEDMLFHI